MTTLAASSTGRPTDWQSANQARLVAELETLKDLLRLHAERGRPPLCRENGVSHSPEPSLSPERPLADLPQDSRSPIDGTAQEEELPSAMDMLCAAFSLSAFERHLLVLCAGMELDSAVASLCGAAQGDPNRGYPTFSLGLAALPNAHWSALGPGAPLRRWRLIEVGTGPALTLALLRIDERVLHYLVGVRHPDERLAGMLEPIEPTSDKDLAPSHALVALNIVAAWSAQRGQTGLPAVQLCCSEPANCRPVAAAAASAVGLRAVALPSDLIPASAAELDALLRLWEREAALGGTVMLVECDDDPPAGGDDTRARNVARFVERLAGPVMVSVREPQRLCHRPAITFNVNNPTTTEQCDAWRAAFAPAKIADPTWIDEIGSQFSLSFPAIRSTAAEALARFAASPEVDVAAIAWQSCRTRCRRRLDGLAQRIEPAAGWEDLVLPEPQIWALRQIAAQVHYRTKVYESWGFAAKSSRGLGIAALFSGVSGTGKTMAAEVLARELHLDLYRIDLSSTVSKYIGETEKNLRRVFDAAEESGAILSFDEADALFGKRSEVKDSHDRYANIEVSYLLQRMEAYRGLAILTTNLKSALDTAFLRRLRFIVQFPFPDAPQRAEIWRRIFPRETPIEGLDYTKLAKLNIPGGNIRNIALNAAFVAVEHAQPVRMSYILTAARAEYGKLERPLTDAEIGGWQ